MKKTKKHVIIVTMLAIVVFLATTITGCGTKTTTETTTEAETTTVAEITTEKAVEITFDIKVDKENLVKGIEEKALIEKDKEFFVTQDELKKFVEREDLSGTLVIPDKYKYDKDDVCVVALSGKIVKEEKETTSVNEETTTETETTVEETTTAKEAKAEKEDILVDNKNLPEGIKEDALKIVEKSYFLEQKDIKDYLEENELNATLVIAKDYKSEKEDVALVVLKKISSKTSDTGEKETTIKDSKETTTEISTKATNETDTNKEAGQPEADQPEAEEPAAPASPSHEHNWVAVTHEEPVYKTIRHEEQGHYETVIIQDAWDEQVDNGYYEMNTVCKGCGKNITSEWMNTKDFDDHMYNHAVAGEPSGWEDRSVWVPNVTTVHHDAVTEKKWIVDQAAWDEQVSNGTQTVTDYYKCSSCGATQ